jgi:hypothetical protein
MARTAQRRIRRSELAMRALAAAVILLTIAGFAVFIYGDVVRYDGLRVAGVALVALAGIGLLISVAYERRR